MKFKRFLAMALAAGIVFTSSVNDVSLVRAEEISGTESAEEGTQAQEDNTETGSTENPWIESIGTVEDTEEGLDREKYPERDTSLPEEAESGVKTSEEQTKIKNKQNVDESAESEKEEAGDVKMTEVGKDSVSADLYADVTDKVAELQDTSADDEMVRVIIVMDGDSVIEKNAKASLNFWTKIQSNVIESKQNRVVSKIENKVLDGETLDVKYHYTWLLNGVATEVPYGMIDDIEALAGVEDVIIQPVYEVAEESDIEPYTIADGEMIGREDTWSSGYTGKGIKIAIIDTGLDDDHQNFQAMSEDKLTEDSATKDTVASVLGELNASSLYPNLTVDQVYHSNKVAFGFNYVDQSTIINHSKDTQGDHGTHVAGIAAANDLGNGEAVGVAPDAQLYIMKIFGTNGGAFTEDILASLEDALKLDADVVNMSLGSPAGFTSEGEKLDEIYARVAETNTILAVAAGNSTTSGLSNMWGTDTNLASNPDNSIISAPAAFQNVTSVASMENSKIQSSYFEVNGQKFSYIEGANGANESISTLFGKDLEYAMVGNFGQKLEDFTDADVEGKIAVVQRGVSNFTTKNQLAEDAGAIGCLIYNNTSGTISMGLNSGTAVIPCASITLSAGEYLASVKEENQNATINFSAKKELMPSESAGQMSDFTSWGVSPDLRLEPDITAPGGNIYSTLDGGNYGLMSGTSMASPNVAGISALVMQYAKATNPKMSDADLHTFVNDLLISTSTPVVYDKETGLTYSPRQQGSGLANAYSATKTKAYLTVDDNDMPEAQLFDDVDKNGSYSFTYHVNNFGDSAIYYSLSTKAQTEGVEAIDEYKFMSTTPYALSAATNEVSDSFVYTYDYDGNNKTDSHDARALYLTATGKTEAEENAAFRYDVDKTEGIDKADVQAYLDALVGKESEADLDSQVLKVEAGKTADVSVSIALSDADRTYMDSNFENGIYVEGFTYLEAESDGDVDLSMPYLGFYGDWTKAPAIDDGYYWESDDETNASQYVNILWTSIEGSNWFPGLNPYIEDEPFDVKNITMSPNEDGITDAIEDVYISLLRNAKTMEISYENAKTGEVYYDETYDNVSKTYYVSSAGSMMPFIQAYYSNNQYGFTDKDGNVLPNNTVATMKAKASIDYDRHDSANTYDTWEVPITVDTEAPTIKEAQVLKSDSGKQYLRLTFSDNQKVAGVCFLNKSGAVVKAKYAVDAEPGEEVTAEYDITGYGNEFMIALGDYAVNETYYEVETEDNVPEVDTDLLYGYRVYTDSIYDDTLFGWVALNPEKLNADGKLEVEEQDSEYYVDYSLQAAVYVDGYILAVNAGGQLVRMTPGIWDDRTVIADYGFEIKELTYDPQDKVLYGYTSSVAAGTFEIVKIDILSGELTKLGTQSTFTTSRPFAMACDNEGALYGINSNGELKTIDKTTGKWNAEVLAETNLKPAGVQSMVYSSEDNCFYWAAYLSGETSFLYKIDLTNGYNVTKIAALADNPQINGLILLDDNGFDIPEENAEKITLNTDDMSVLKGTSASLTVAAEPWYGEMGVLEWSSSDESVASVDLKGKITGKHEGDAVITVTSRDIPGLTASCTVHVIEPKTDLYGFVIGSNAGAANQWLHVNTGYLKGAETVSGISMVTYAAAEYYDGMIYAYDDTTEFYKIDPKTYEATKLTNADSMWSVKDMAYDYSTGYMYGIATYNGDGMTYLIHIDTTTGLIEKADERPITDSKDGLPITIAVSTDGTIYMITETGFLCKYVDDGNGNDENWMQPYKLETIGVTGVTHAAGLTSMTYDHNTGDMYFSYADTVSVEQLALVDQKNGTALTLGAVAGGAQIVGFYTVPDKIPERENVPVTGISATTDMINMVSGMKIAAPVNVQPFNATDKTIKWTVSDDSVVSVKDNMLIAGKKGTATVTAEIAGKTAEFNVNVYDAAGDIHGFIVYDFMYEETNIWAKFNDSDLSTGIGLANTDDYGVDAAEYYNGKVYVYDNMNSQYLVLNAESTKYEVEKRIKIEHPDMADMAFDYSEGVMYAISCVRNVDSNTTLYAVNIEDGTFYKIGDQNTTLKAIACTTDGTLYGVDSYGDFYQIDKRTGEEEYLFSTEYSANVYQSMAYDHNTGNLYWAQCYWDIDFGSEANLMLIDVEKQNAMVLGQVGASGCQVTGLYIEPKEEIAIEKPAVETVRLSSQDELLAVGGAAKLSAFVEPLSVSYADAAFTFQSSNENVATVDAEGNITAVGVGTATVTASYEGKTAACEVTVVDNETEVYVMNPNGWETSPLMDPMTITGKTLLSDHNTSFRIARATLNNDGYLYAIGEDGYLWKFTKDLATIEKIGDKKVLDQLDNRQALEDANPYGGVEDIQLKDITANPYTGKVYILVVVNYGSSYVYELDTETGAAAVVRQLPWDVLAQGCAMTFESEDSLIVYAGDSDFIYRVPLTEGDATGIVWAQGTVVSSDDLAMYYNRKLNRVFLTTTNDSPYDETKTIDLYVLNLDTNTFKKISQAAYNQEVKGLIMFENIEPAEGAAAEELTEAEALEEASSADAEKVSEAVTGETEKTETVTEDTEESKTETVTEGTEENNTETVTEAE